MESLMQLVVILSFFAVVIAFAFAVYLYLWVKRQLHRISGSLRFPL